MSEFMSQPWPWYISGPLLGLTMPLLLLIANKELSISSNLRHLCAAISPPSIRYFNYNWKKESWNLFLLAGVFAGAWYAHIYFRSIIGVGTQTYVLLQKQGVQNINGLAPSDIFSWKGLYTLKGFIMIIVGGFLIGFGSRYAKGCISGHGIVGLSSLSMQSLIAVVGFFIGGLTMTHLILPYILQLEY